MRLIDADKLPLDIEREDVDDAPTVDAVEVVRCKDCKYYDVNLADGTTCFCTRLELFNEYDWFCADGEREEQNNEK